jgi:hypothetical protein
MPNITMTLEKDLVQKVRKVAAERHTTLTALVRQHLQTVAAREDSRKRRAASRLRASFTRLGRDMGPRTWKREELHAR